MATMHWEDREFGRRIRLEGDMDHVGCEQVRFALDAAVLGSSLPVIIDLSRVDILSSQGIAQLLRAQGHARTRGQTLFVDGLDDHKRKVLDTVGIFQAIPEWVEEEPWMPLGCLSRPLC
ncbi:MAG: STAS domain-containing protein [Planctomycetota bacterium]|jgi:anti-anti-sigma factor